MSGSLNINFDPSSRLQLYINQAVTLSIVTSCLLFWFFPWLASIILLLPVTLRYWIYVPGIFWDFLILFSVAFTPYGTMFSLEFLYNMSSFYLTPIPVLGVLTFFDVYFLQEIIQVLWKYLYSPLQVLWLANDPEMLTRYFKISLATSTIGYICYSPTHTCSWIAFGCIATYLALKVLFSKSESCDKTFLAMIFMINLWITSYYLIILMHSLVSITVIFILLSSMCLYPVGCFLTPTEHCQGLLDPLCDMLPQLVNHGITHINIMYARLLTLWPSLPNLHKLGNCSVPQILTNLVAWSCTIRQFKVALRLFHFHLLHL